MSHDQVLSTMEHHQQSVIKQLETTSKEAILELKGKADEVDHLRTKVDTDLLQVWPRRCAAGLLFEMAISVPPVRLCGHGDQVSCL